MGLVGCAKRRHAWGGWSESGKTGGTWAVVASEASCSEVSEFIIFGQVRGKVSSMFYVVARNFQFANDGRLLSLENFSNASTLFLLEAERQDGHPPASRPTLLGYAPKPNKQRSALE